MERPFELQVSILDRRTGDTRKGLRICLTEWDSEMCWSLATLLSDWVQRIHRAGHVAADNGGAKIVGEFVARYPRDGS